MTTPPHPTILILSSDTAITVATAVLDAQRMLMNLHPLIVHFPIALLTVGALCDAVGILGRRDLFLKTGYLLLLLGTAGAAAAALTGESAAETAAKIPDIKADLEQHETLSTAAAWLSIALTLARTHLSFKKRFAGTPRLIYLFLALVLAGLINTSGYTGGHIVYTYGAGTGPVMKHLEASSLQ